MKRIIRDMAVAITIASALAMAWSGIAAAHVTVKPAQAETAAFQAFTVSTPTEGESPTVKVRLMVPDGVKHVTPTVKPGWQIDVAKDGEGEEAVVKEITWSGGSVPVGQRDDFGFSAQMPAQASTLQWKAYQTHADGRIVAWDQAPTGGHGEEGSDSGPYSETKVVDDLAAGTTDGHGSGDAESSAAGETRSNVALGISIVALVLGVVALTLGRAPAGKSNE